MKQGPYYEDFMLRLGTYDYCQKCPNESAISNSNKLFYELKGQVDALICWRALNLSPQNLIFCQAQKCYEGGKGTIYQFLPKLCNEMTYFAKYK